MKESPKHTLRNSLIRMSLGLAIGSAGIHYSNNSFFKPEFKQLAEKTVTETYPGFNPQTYKDAQLTRADFDQTNQQLIAEQHVKQLPPVEENVNKAETYLVSFKQAETIYESKIVEKKRLNTSEAILSLSVEGAALLVAARGVADFAGEVSARIKNRRRLKASTNQ